MKRSVAIVSAGLLLALPAFGLQQAQARTARAGTTLTIWSDWGQDEVAAAKPLVAKWGAAQNISVKFVSTTDPGRGAGFSIDKAFPLKAKSADGPDVIYVPQDETGTFVASGLLAPVPSSLLSSAEAGSYGGSYLDVASLDGKRYGLPFGVDGTMLYYNKKLVPTPPSTWAQLISQSKALRKGNQYGLLFPIGDPNSANYFGFFPFTGFGGYIFKNTGGKYDFNDIGLANAGAIEAGKFIAGLTKDNVLPGTTNYNVMDSNFSSGKAGMVINGPWALTQYSKALGANLGIANIPTLPNGKPSQPFIGVRVFEVNAFSKNQGAAFSLAKYLSLNTQAALTPLEGRLPSVKGVKLSALQQAAAKQFAQGVPIPNIPEMGQVWTPFGNALALIAQGRATPEKALPAAVAQIKAGIAKLNQ